MFSRRRKHQQYYDGQSTNLSTIAKKRKYKREYTIVIGIGIITLFVLIILYSDGILSLLSSRKNHKYITEATNQILSVWRPDTRALSFANYSLLSPKTENDQIIQREPERIDEQEEFSNFHPFKYYDFHTISKNSFIFLINNSEPIIFKNVIKNNDLRKCEITNFCNSFKSNFLMVRYGNYGDTEGRKNRKFKNVTMEAYCSSIKNGSGEYGGNNKFDQNIFHAMKIKPNCNFLNDFPRVMKIWIGPQKSRTPLHKDSPDNLALQLYGKKKWVIYDRKDNSNLCFPTNNEKLEWSKYSINDYDTCQQATHVTPYNIVLNAGEMLYLPKQWAHDCTNLVQSIMVNFWYHNINSLKYWYGHN
eukprot:415507_1